MTPDEPPKRLSSRFRPLVRRLGDALRPRTRAATTPYDSGELDNLRARLDRLESVIEGLQDSLYRETQRHDAELDDLRGRVQPAEIARALSDDARKRGL